MKTTPMKKRNTVPFWAFLCLGLASIGTAIANPGCPADSMGTSLTASCCYEPGTSGCISESKDSNDRWKILQNISGGSSCDVDHTCL